MSRSTWKAMIDDAKIRHSEKRDPKLTPLFPAPGYYTGLMVRIAEETNYQNPSIKKGSSLVCMLNLKCSGQEHRIQQLTAKSAREMANIEEALREKTRKEIEAYYAQNTRNGAADLSSNVSTEQEITPTNSLDSAETKAARKALTFAERKAKKKHKRQSQLISTDGYQSKMVRKKKPQAGVVHP